MQWHPLQPCVVYYQPDRWTSFFTKSLEAGLSNFLCHPARHHSLWVPDCDDRAALRAGGSSYDQLTDSPSGRTDLFRPVPHPILSGSPLAEKKRTSSKGRFEATEAVY